MDLVFKRHPGFDPRDRTFLEEVEASLFAARKAVIEEGLERDQLRTELAAAKVEIEKLSEFAEDQNDISEALESKLEMAEIKLTEAEGRLTETEDLLLRCVERLDDFDPSDELYVNVNEFLKGKK